MKRRTQGLSPEPLGEVAPEVMDDGLEHSGLFNVRVSPPPPDLVTSERLKSVRFDLAQPRGYFTEQVDTLVRDLTNSLAWYEEAVYQRDQGIHTLQTDLDVAAQQEASLRAQIEVFRVQGSVTVGADGQILRKSQVGVQATDEHAQALAEARGATAAVERRLATSVEEVRSLREWADTVIPQTEQIAEGARVAQEQLAETVQDLAAERERTTQLSAQVADMGSTLGAQPAPTATLAAATEPTESVDLLARSASGTETVSFATGETADGFTPEPVVETTSPDILAPDPAGDDDRPVVAADPAVVATGPDGAPGSESEPEREWNLDDPELPVGVVFPRAKYDREYIPAGQGDPLLVVRRSPLTVWAPELQPAPDDVAGVPDAVAEAEILPLPPGAPTTADAPDPSPDEDQWGAPLAQPDPMDATQVILQGEASPSDVSDGVARAQLRRQV